MKINWNFITPTVLMLTGLVLRVTYLQQYSASPLFDIPLGPDVQEYDQWARNIIINGIFSGGAQIHAPLYPWFLSLLYRVFSFDFFYIRLSQEVLGLLSFLPLYLVIRRVWRDCKFMADIFLGVAAVFPPLIYYQGELVCEALLLPLLNLALACFLYGEYNKSKRVIYYAAAGLCGGLAMITHPLSGAFVLPLFLTACWRCRRGKGFKKVFSPAALALTAIIPVLLIAGNNASKESPERGFYIQRNSGFNFWVGNNPKATGGCWVRPGPSWDQIHYDAEVEAAKKEISKDRVFWNRTGRFIIDQPGAFLFNLIKKGAMVWNHGQMPSGADVKPLRFYMTFPSLPGYGIVAFLGLLGVYLAMSRHRDRVRFIPLVGVLLCYFLALVITVVSSRYRLSLLPVLFISSAFCICVIIQKRGVLSLPCRLFGIGMICLVFLPSLPHFPFEKSEADSLLGEAYYRHGKLLKAKEHLERSIISEPWSRSYCMLGAVEKLLNNRKRAVELFKKGAETSPNDPMGLMNLGVMASEENRNKTANAYFKQALNIDPKNPDTLYNFAVFRMKLGDLLSADKMLNQALQTNPSHRLSVNQLGLCLMRQRKFGEAANFFRKALQLDPENSGLALNLAVAYLESGKKAEAVKIVNGILQNDPKNPGALKLKQILAK